MKMFRVFASRSPAYPLGLFSPTHRILPLLPPRSSAWMYFSQTTFCGAESGDEGDLAHLSPSTSHPQSTPLSNQHSGLQRDGGMRMRRSGHGALMQLSKDVLITVGSQPVMGAHSNLNVSVPTVSRGSRLS